MAHQLLSEASADEEDAVTICIGLRTKRSDQSQNLKTLVGTISRRTARLSSMSPTLTEEGATGGVNIELLTCLRLHLHPRVMYCEVQRFCLFWFAVQGDFHLACFIPRGCPGFRDDVAPSTSLLPATVALFMASLISFF